jgi:hypothetical protein
MPMGNSGLYFIDLEHTEGRKEASFDFEKLKTKNEMEKHFEELKM